MTNIPPATFHLRCALNEARSSGLLPVGWKMTSAYLDVVMAEYGLPLTSDIDAEPGDRFLGLPVTLIDDAKAPWQLVTAEVDQ